MKVKHLQIESLHKFCLLVLASLIVGCSQPSPTESWQRASDGVLSVEMPSPTTRQEQTVESKFGPLTVSVFKSALRGVHYNLWTFQHPDGAADLFVDSEEVLNKTATGHEIQKKGAIRDSFEYLAGAAYPSASHQFSYPAGVNSEGKAYRASFARYRYHLVGMTIHILSADIDQEFYNDRKDEIETDLSRFFNSMTLVSPKASQSESQ